jgi:CheY-like chemotaxis protein
MSDKILFVDDESSALDGFQRVLRGKFDVSTAISGGEGLVRIQRNGPYAVVISDMRMPGMNGAEFLARVREAAPQTIRMLLTGHADLRSAIDAVNRGNIFHFLTKPCEREVLVAALNSGIDQYHALMTEKDLAGKARALERSGIDWKAIDVDQQETFESPVGLPGPAEAKAYLERAGKNADGYVALLHLPVLQTVEQRYGEGASVEYLRTVAGFLQQSLRAGDRLFHWRRDVLMAVAHRFISPAAVRMEMERLIAETRGYIIEIQGRPMMIACLITFDLLPVSQFPDLNALLAACASSIAGPLPESAEAV